MAPALLFLGTNLNIIENEIKANNNNHDILDFNTFFNSIHLSNTLKKINLAADFSKF